MQLSYIKIFIDALESIEALDDAERGRLFTALLTYAKTGESPVLQGNERFLFPMFRGQLDRDAAAYEEMCERNRRAGARGGRAERKHSLADASQEEDKEKDKEKEEEKDKDSSIMRAGGPPDRTAGLRPSAGRQRAKKYGRKEADDAAAIQADMARMDRYRQELIRKMGENPSCWVGPVKF